MIILVHGELKQAHAKIMKQQNFKKELEKPLPDILSVMSICNKAHFEKSRHSFRSKSTMLAMEKAVKERQLTGAWTKKFVVV